MTTTNILSKTLNGNVEKTIFSDGSREILCDDVDFKLEEPLNIDIRVSTSCSFGYNKVTNKSYCDFCHESAVTDGIDCDYSILKNKLELLSPGLELAIGCNRYTDDLEEFLIWCKSKGFICSLTVNQGHLLRDLKKFKSAQESNVFYGLGVSYRPDFKNVLPPSIINNENVVFHVISGIDTIDEIKELSTKSVKKILILGEKDFGFNENKVDLKSKNHRDWFYGVHELFSLFEVVSFDNLALEQMKIKRFFTNQKWKAFYNHEYSMYIDAANQNYSKSSRSASKTNWSDTTIKEYFSNIA